MSRRFIVEPATITMRSGAEQIVWVVIDTARGFMASVHRDNIAAGAQARERNRCFEDAR